MSRNGALGKNSMMALVKPSSKGDLMAQLPSHILDHMILRSGRGLDSQMWLLLLLHPSEIA